jgi:soluble lytic murein transglycosylase-like protein
MSHGSIFHRAASLVASRRELRTAGALIAVLSVSLSSRADIRTHVDKNGVISFTNSPKKESPSKEARPVASGPGITVPSDGSLAGLGRYDAHIRQAAMLYQIPEELIRAVIQVESGFDPRAISPKNARGLMQLIPETAERMTVTDVFDPRQNIFGGVRYLRVLANLFNGDLELTIAGYNAGEHAVMRYRGIPPFAETQAYVTRVIGYYRHYRSLGARARAQ